MIRAILLLVLTLAACAAPPPEPPDAAFIAPNLRLAVPPPASIGQTVTIDQTVVAHYRDHDFSFESELAIGPNGLDLVALDGFGRRAFTIAWHGATLTSDAAPWLPGTIRPANMLADIALIYWPADVLRPALAAAGATLTTDSNSRSVRFGGREVIRITYDGAPGWTGSTHYRNLVFGYSLDIESAKVDP